MMGRRFVYALFDPHSPYDFSDNHVRIHVVHRIKLFSSINCDGRKGPTKYKKTHDIKLSTIPLLKYLIVFQLTHFIRLIQRIGMYGRGMEEQIYHLSIHLLVMW